MSPPAAAESGFGLVEALIAVTILVIGLMAVAGLTLATAAQVRIATIQGGQTVAAQQVLEELQLAGFDAAASGTDTVSVDGRDYVVTVTVTTASARVKNVQASVAGVGSLGAQTMTTRLYKPRPLPSGP